MFNDLPENLKKELRNQYYIRLSIVAGLMFLLVQIVGLFFIFPSWTLSVAKKQELQTNLAALTEPTSAIRNTPATQSISSTNQILHVLHTTLGYPQALPFFNTILSFKKSGIQLNKFSYVSKSNTEAIMSVGGIAATREVLVAFVKDLKSSGSFITVDLPVSNLAKDTNIEFAINIIISQKS